MCQVPPTEQGSHKVSVDGITHFVLVSLWGLMTVGEKKVTPELLFLILIFLVWLNKKNVWNKTSYWTSRHICDFIIVSVPFHSSCSSCSWKLGRGMAYPETTRLGRLLVLRSQVTQGQRSAWWLWTTLSICSTGTDSHRGRFVYLICVLKIYCFMLSL